MAADEWGKGPAIETGETDTENQRIDPRKPVSDSGSVGPATPYEDFGPADVPTDPSDADEGTG